MNNTFKIFFNRHSTQQIEMFSHSEQGTLIELNFYSAHIFSVLNYVLVKNSSYIAITMVIENYLLLVTFVVGYSRQNKAEKLSAFF